MTATDPAMTTPAHGERRLAVLLFADLSGYTRLCRTLDPEDVAATVLPLLAEIRAAVTAEGGVATGVAGDGFLAVFGVPLSGADIADRAVRAAWEMRALVRARSASLNAQQVPDIHIGITAGEVLAFPSDDPSGLSFIGPAVNLASRLSDAAGAGSILVDDNLRRLLSDKSALADPHELVLQGHEDGVRVWRLATAGASEASIADVPFVGRHDLMDQLDATARTSSESRQLQVVAMLGEAGIGKSTLLREWVRRRSSPTVWTNCLDVAFGAHLEHVMRQLRAEAQVEPTPVRLPRPVATEVLLTRPAEDVATRVREVVGLLHRVGGDALTVVLDDFHAADDELRAVVDALGATSVPVPVVVVCASRRDETQEPADSQAMVLPPLDEDAVTTLVTAAIGAQPPQPVVDALVSRAEGRPLAALQSSAYLVESGTVAVRDSHCVLVAPHQLADLPDTMRLFVAGRLDRLPPSEKQLLQELSAVGTSIRINVVERLFGAEAARLVDALTGRGFLIRRDSHVAFSHGVVHEVAYASLPRAVRARIHRRIVEENAFEDDALRAQHARRWAASATETAPAERRLAVAAALGYTARHAQSLYSAHVRNAYVEARSVRALIDEDVAIAPMDAARLLVLLSSCGIQAGRYDEALAEANHAIDVCRHYDVDGALLVAALCAQGEALSQLRHYQSARQSLEEAMQIAAVEGDQMGRGRALRLLGDTYRHSDSQRLVELIEEAFDILSSCQDEAGAAEAARTMAYWLSVSTAPKLQRWFDEAERRTPIDDLRGRLELARTHAFAAAARYDYATARDKSRACRDLGRELGMGEVTVDGLMIGVESAAALGLLGEAIALFGELERFAARRGEPRLRQMAAVVGLQPLQRTGARERADDALSQALALRDAFGPPETMMAAAAVGLTARDRGDWALAMEQLDVAVGASDASGFAISSLVLRQELTLTSAMLGLPSPEGQEVARLAEAGGAPAVASAARAAMSLVDESVRLAGAPGTLQETAVRADAHALRLERQGDDARDAWQAAAQEWSRLGSTVFLARAQARSGDRDAAVQTLQVIGAADEARDWAFGK